MSDDTSASTAELRDKLQRYGTLPPLGRSPRGITLNETRIRPGDVLEHTGADRDYQLIIDCDEFDIICYRPDINSYTNYPSEMVAADLSDGRISHHSQVIR